MRRSTPAWALGLFLFVGGCAANPSMHASVDEPGPVAAAHPEGYGAGLPERAGVLTAEIRAWLPAARRIAADALIIDTHIDVRWRPEKEAVDVTRATEDGDFDHPRAIPVIASHSSARHFIPGFQRDPDDDMSGSGPTTTESGTPCPRV